MSDLAAAPGRIVVGVDEGPASRAALAWAVEEAQLRRCPLEIVHTWHALAPVEPAGMVAVPPPDLDLEAAGRRQVVEVVTAVRARSTCWPEDVTVQVLEGPPGPVLVELGEGADLLVVGSKGRNALAEVLLGSVSRHVTHHASCPVVVVRPPATRHKRH